MGSAPWMLEVLTGWSVTSKPGLWLWGVGGGGKRGRRSVYREAESQTSPKTLHSRLPGDWDMLNSLRSTALGFFISFTKEWGPYNSSLRVLRAQRWPLANYRISTLGIGNSWKSSFGKDPHVFWQYTKNTVKIAFCTNSPNHDMSIYDLGLVVLLVKQYIKSTYRNRLNK